METKNFRSKYANTQRRTNFIFSYYVDAIYDKGKDRATHIGHIYDSIKPSTE